MPFTCRITVFFQQGDYGWTETLFNSAGDYTLGRVRATAYLNQRILLMSANVKLLGARISDDEVFRDSNVIFLNPPAIGTLSAGALHPTTALLMRLVGNELVRRPLYLRGLPQTIIDPNGAYLPDPVFAGRIIAFIGFLLRGDWQVKSTLAGPAHPRLLLTLVAPPNNFATLGPHGYNPGDIVSIQGPSHGHNPTGRFRVFTTAPPTGFTLSGVDLPADYVYQPMTLRVQKKLATLQTVTNAVDERLTERKTGRPFGQPRGRRSPRRV